MSNIETLKSSLGTGIGLRKNKFLIEIPLNNVDGSKLDVLVKNASFPERKINAVKIMHKGRQYNVRGETEYPGTFEVTVIDDSNMSIRKSFDLWFKDIDDSAKTSKGGLGTASFETGTKGLLDILQSGKSSYKDIQQALQDPTNAVSNTLVGLIDPSQKSPTAKYQVDINVWQLSGTGQKIYGYKLQNAFPISMGTVSFDDSEQNTLTEYTVEFAYSEFVELENTTGIERVANTVLGNLKIL